MINLKLLTQSPSTESVLDLAILNVLLSLNTVSCSSGHHPQVQCLEEAQKCHGSVQQMDGQHWNPVDCLELTGAKSFVEISSFCPKHL